jgi:hypothetical protein
VERRAKRDPPVGGKHLRDVGGGEDQQSRASLAGADDELGDATFLTPKLFDHADRSKSRVDPEADANREGVQQCRSRSVIRCLFELSAAPLPSREGRSGATVEAAAGSPQALSRRPLRRPPTTPRLAQLAGEKGRLLPISCARLGAQRVCSPPKTRSRCAFGNCGVYSRMRLRTRRPNGP